MHPFLQKLQGLLAGRRGLDQLSVALLLGGCLLTFALSFFRVPYYRLIGLVPMALSLLRVLSKNIDAREKENLRFLRFWEPVKQKCTVWFQHASDKDHRYYKCPGCKRTLRVPKNRGKIEISCPHCGTKFKKRT